MDFDASDNNNRGYKVGAIRDIAIYVRELEFGYLLKLYYLISWKIYLEEENIWKPYLAIQHLKKLISLFHIDHLNK